MTASSSASRPTWVGDVRRHVLDNGMTVLVERDDTAPVVATVAHVRAGYFDEPDEWVGISHVLEHMYFKGANTLESGELARETRRLGGYLNAGTTYDKTFYYTVLPASPGALARAVELQAAALTQLEIDPDELARELEVIVQEVRRKLDTPAAVVGETLYEQLFERHRMRRWRMGKEEELRRLNRDALTQYYRTRYTPDRTIIAVVGDLDPDEAFELVEHRYGGWAAPEASFAPSPQETSPATPKLKVVRGDVKRPIAALGWRTVDSRHADAPALDVAAAVLTMGKGGWLARSVTRTGHAATAAASHYTPTEVGVFSIQLESDESKLGEAIDRSTALVQRLIERGPSQADLERVRSLMSMLWSRRLEGMDGRASLWCEFEALGSWTLAVDTYRAQMEIAAAAVQRAAAAHLRREVVTGVVYLPGEIPSPVEPARWPPVDGSVVPVAEVAPYAVPRVSARRLSASAGIARFPGGVVRAETDAADLIVRSKRGSGLAFVGAYASGLRHLEDADSAGLSALLTRVALRGAKGLDADQLAERAERIGGVLTPFLLFGAAGWGITVRADAVDEAVRLLMDVACEPTLGEDDVRIERRLQASDARRTRDDMYHHPVRSVLECAYPGAPYGRPEFGDPDRVGDFTKAQLDDWAGRMRSRRLAVVAVGDVEHDRLLGALAPFQEWPGTTRSDPAEQFDAWVNERVVERRDKEQTALALAFGSTPYDSPRRYTAIVLSALLSGLAGRLFERLRAQRSLAYTVKAMPWHRRTVGAMLGYIATSPDREDEAREAMLQELVGIATESIAEDELTMARHYAAGALQLRLQSSHAVASELLEAALLDGIDDLDGAAERLRAVTGDEIREFAAATFVADRRAEYVVRGGAA